LEEADIERLIGGAPRVALEDIVGHPRLPDARKVYIDRFLDIYGDDPFLVRLLIESGRFFVYNLTVVLEAAQDPARRETWLTVGLLKQEMAVLGLASSRHVDHLIARLWAVGFMELQPSDQDRRVLGRLINRNADFLTSPKHSATDSLNRIQILKEGSLRPAR
jgi:hypothetical protein